jgi:hypothetical protein
VCGFILRLVSFAQSRLHRADAPLPGSPAGCLDLACNPRAHDVAGNRDTICTQSRPVKKNEIHDTERVGAL